MVEVTQTVILENVVENMTDGMLVIGFDGKIRMENGMAARLIGRGADTLCGKTMVELMVDNKDNDAFFQCIIDAIYEKTKVCKTITYATKGETRHLRVVVSPLRDVEHNIALSVMFSDVTELMELGKKNRKLNYKMMEFVNNFVKVMIGAVEARTPYNATHTKKMVLYATKYLDWVEESGRLKHIERRSPLLASIWLHDIGKLVIPTHIMDKPDRLGDHKNEVLHRIDMGIVCERLRMAENPEKEADATAKIEELKEAKEIIIKTNSLGFADEETKQKIDRIAHITCLNSAGEYIPLLDEYEYEALCITKGTLTKDERRIMESHVSHTFDMLMQMHFDGVYENIPEWAAKHHELLDGSGYPDNLTADDIPWEVRLLTIIDVYDALTAEDRPYKRPMEPEKAFDILKDMSDKGKIDREVLDDFIESGAWKL